MEVSPREEPTPMDIEDTKQIESLEIHSLIFGHVGNFTIGRWEFYDVSEVFHYDVAAHTTAHASNKAVIVKSAKTPKWVT